MAERLADEISPYLRQHRDHPVDWWPWGPAAFLEASRLKKPVFVSIGYAACHWCHVMAHESFADPRTAEVLNELFISIKVDREELPEVDAIYMQALAVMGEHGGWPLSAFCLPDGRPFYLGTYFPKQEKYGKPSFVRVVQTLAEAYRNDGERLLENAASLTEGLAESEAHMRQQAIQHGHGIALSPATLATAYGHLLSRQDAVRGGLVGAPKFPCSPMHKLLARAAASDEAARRAFMAWTMGMARGGLFDHVAGGFARYAVDDKWLVPHFEKMLYDNGQLLELLAMARRWASDAERVEVDAAASATVAWLAREMRDASGGFFTALDADSEGREGAFYVWTAAQLREVLGAADAMQFMSAYGATDNGNFEHGQNVLSRVTPVGSASDEAALADMRQRLFDARAKRPRPGTDNKILASANGLAIRGLVAWHRTTGDETSLSLALGAATFIWQTLWQGDHLARVFCDGVIKHRALLDDYAFVAAAYCDLAEVTGDGSWWSRSETLMGIVRREFVGADRGDVIFYMTAPIEAGDSLVHRPESHQDGAVPSGAAVAVETLVRHGQVAGRADALTLAEQYLQQRLAGKPNPFAHAALMTAAATFMQGDALVIALGQGEESLREAALRHAPLWMAMAGSWASEDLRAGKESINGAAVAYVCRGQTCSPPTTIVDELVVALAVAGP